MASTQSMNTVRRRTEGGPEGWNAGQGGETHQTVSTGAEQLTTNQGVAISDNQNSLRAGRHGPSLLEDMILREKINHFDHERIPERIVHARGSGAHGYFELYESLEDITTADIFQRAGEKTPVFARFSTVAGGAGSVDTPRDVRGFAVKFYTKEGNWDLVGNNISPFFIQDAIKFPDLVHSVKMEADKGYPQAASAHDTFWDFVSLVPETTHMIMWAMSDRALPRSLAFMQGFGVHTFRFINKEGKNTFVRFTWNPKYGLQSTVWDETLKIAGANPDYHRQDLFNRINRGAYPEWELGLQLFDEELANSLPYDVLDSTKVIPEEIVPLKIVGKMVLNRNVNNFFAETEQVAFCPSHVVPGIDFTDDPLLQGRLFSYLDTQLSRLGSTNFHQIPINQAKGRSGCPFLNFQRDGHMQMNIPKGRANYEPNSLHEAGEIGGPREDPKKGFHSYPSSTDGSKLRVRPDLFADHYSQARMFFRSLHPAEQTHVAAAIVFELSKVTLKHVQKRVLANLRNVDQSLAERIANGLNIELPEATPSAAPVQDLDLAPSLRIIGNMKETLQGREVAIMVADGSDYEQVHILKKQLEDEGAAVKIVAPKVGGVKASNGEIIAADGKIEGEPSVLVDAVAIVLSSDGANMLKKSSEAVQFIMDAFSHLKAVGYTDGARVLLDKAGVEDDEGVVNITSGKFIAAAKKRFFDREPDVRILP